MIHSLLPYAIAYLLGSIPFGYLLVRVFRRQDIRAHGSGNIGATNVARSGSKGLGVATLLLDLGKGALAVLVARHLAGGSLDVGAFAALVAVCGHVFPVWLAFRGGKGVATALGVFLALSPRSAAVLFLVFLGVFLLTRFVSLASIVAAGTYPLIGFHFIRGRTPGVVIAFLVIPLLVIVKHHGNIGRLLRGTESRFGTRPTPGKAEA
ncbi:MAG: glycerol-3-phosphate 1-O-acyltransferase PlsY [Acidobacteriota bacterium]|nr:glycerol-3-phosphate 1-O-acyltransferase PlsY [Acidobacteriota bacterium]